MASDAIYQEVLKVQQAGKPVVVSMGNLAASGGYYISGCCFANPLPPPSPTHASACLHTLCNFSKASDHYLGKAQQCFVIAVKMTLPCCSYTA